MLQSWCYFKKAIKCHNMHFKLTYLTHAVCCKVQHPELRFFKLFCFVNYLFLSAKRILYFTSTLNCSQSMIFSECWILSLTLTLSLRGFATHASFEQMTNAVTLLLQTVSENRKVLLITMQIDSCEDIGQINVDIIINTELSLQGF